MSFCLTKYLTELSESGDSMNIFPSESLLHTSSQQSSKNFNSELSFLSSKAAAVLVRDKFRKDFLKLGFLFSLLHHDEHLKEYFFTRSDEQFVKRFVSRAVFYSCYLNILPSPDLEDFYYTLGMVIFRSHEELVNTVVQSIAEPFAMCLNTLLESSELAWYGISLCAHILENRFDDDLQGDTWGEDFLDEYGLTRSLAEIARNVDGFWDEETVDKAKTLFLIEVDTEHFSDDELENFLIES